MRTNKHTRWRALAIGVALFAALALAACSDEQDNASATTDEASISEAADLQVTKGTGGSPISDAATIKESATVNVTSDAGSGSATADTATIAESAKVDVTGGGGSGSTANDTATITESAVTVKESPRPGGSGERALLRDSVTFVVRDSRGVVKDQGILK